MSRPAKLGLLFVALLAALVLLVNLEGSPMRPYDEGLYGRLARNALATGQWLHAVEADGSFSHQLSKPPLSVWLTSLSFASFGPSMWSLRLPFVLCAWLGICVCTAWGMRAQGLRFGLCWGAALALGGATLRWGRYACIEPMFVAFGLLALWGQAESIVASGRRSLAWATLAGLALALAFMTKQLAVGLFVVPMLVVEFVGRGATVGRRVSHWLACFGVPALLCGGWLAAMLAQVGTPFVDVFFRRSIGERVAGFSDGGNRNQLNELADIVSDVALPFPWLLGVLVALLMPWVMRTGARAPAREEPPSAALLLAWSMSALMLTGLLLYDQVSRTLLPWYAFGLVPPLFAGLAWSLARVPELDASSPPREWFVAGLGCLALVMAVVASLGAYMSRLALALALAGFVLVLLRERSTSTRSRELLLVLGFAAVALGRLRDDEFRRAGAPYSQLMRELDARGLSLVAVDRNTRLQEVEYGTYFGSRALAVRVPPWQVPRRDELPEGGEALGLAGVEAYVSAELPPEQLEPPAGIELLRVGGAVAWIGKPEALARPPWSLSTTRALLDVEPLRFEAEHMPSERADTLRSDDDASQGRARAFVPPRRSAAERFFLSLGPNWKLERGNYRASYRVRWSCPAPGVRVGQLWVVASGREIGPLEIVCDEAGAHAWTELELDFDLAHPTPVDLAVIYEAGSLWYDYGTIARR